MVFANVYGQFVQEITSNAGNLLVKFLDSDFHTPPVGGEFLPS